MTGKEQDYTAQVLGLLRLVDQFPLEHTAHLICELFTHRLTPTFTGIIDHNGRQICKGDTVRWMASSGDCFKGTVDFRENEDEDTPFLSGFLAVNIVDITDEVMDDDGNLLNGWNGELEVFQD